MCNGNWNNQNQGHFLITCQILVDFFFVRTPFNFDIINSNWLRLLFKYSILFFLQYYIYFHIIQYQIENIILEWVQFIFWNWFSLSFFLTRIIFHIVLNLYIHFACFCIHQDKINNWFRYFIFDTSIFVFVCLCVEESQFLDNILKNRTCHGDSFFSTLTHYKKHYYFFESLQFTSQWFKYRTLHLKTKTIFLLFDFFRNRQNTDTAVLGMQYFSTAIVLSPTRQRC
jgi:hypothetical protein